MKWIKVVGSTADKHRTTFALYFQGTVDVEITKI